jgi:hypothetical protein
MSLIFDVPSCALTNLKNISPCRYIVFATLPVPLHMAKPIRLHKPELEIFMHSTAENRL